LLNILLTALQESEIEERLNILETKMDEKLNNLNQPNLGISGLTESALENDDDLLGKK
jgi:hypothetical protein